MPIASVACTVLHRLGTLPWSSGLMSSRALCRGPRATKHQLLLLTWREEVAVHRGGDAPALQPLLREEVHHEIRRCDTIAKVPRRKGRSEKTSGSEKTLSQMTSHERRETVARAPKNRRICAQMRRICDAQCHICARRMPHLRRTMPHLRRTMPHLRAQNATSATPPCAICDASMCDLRRFHV